jgi:type IV pilus assembly protein PilM
MAFFSRKKSVLLGVHIGTTAVRLLQLDQQEQRYCVDGYAIEPIPDGVMAESSILDTKALGATIKRAMERTGLRNKCAATAVAGSAVISKTVSLPANLSDRDIENQVILEASQHIPFPLEEVNIDFVVQNLPQHNPGQLDVLWLASRSEHIDSRVATLQEAGLVCEVVDVEPYAIACACAYLIHQSAQAPGGLFAVVNLGAYVSTLSVLHNRELVYSRELNFGSGLPVSEHYPLSAEDAQQNNLPPDENIAQQIQRAIQNFYSSGQYGDIDFLMLAGDGAKLPGIVPLLRKAIGIPVEVVNPFAGMLLSDKSQARHISAHAPSMLVACGLALGSFC